MKSTTQIKVASLGMIIAGVWVSALPLFVTIDSNATMSAIIAGVLLAFVGLVQLFTKSVIPSAIGAITGVWIFASPFLFPANDVFLYNSLVAGAVAFFASLWDTLEVSESFDTTTFAR